MFVLSRVGELDSLLDILNGNKTLEFIIVVNQRQLFDLMLLKDAFRLLKGSSHRSRHQVVAGHNFLDLNGVVMDKTQIPVGQNADQLVHFIDNRYAGNPKFAHQLFRIIHMVLRSK
ncbi:hypothetical protein D3C76_1317800 [compost metagenome]